MAWRIEKQSNGRFAVFSTRLKDYIVIDADAAEIERVYAETANIKGAARGVEAVDFYDNAVVDIASGLRPSPRGELEITDVNNFYLRQNALQVERMGRGFAWFDTGTHEDLLEAGEYVRTIEMRQGLKIACVEEVAYHIGYIDAAQLRAEAQRFGKNDYGRYLMSLLE